MLRSTNVEIELLTDIDQILFVEQNIKGGLSYINQRYCKAGEYKDEVTNLLFWIFLLYIDGTDLHVFITNIEIIKQFFFFSQQLVWTFAVSTNAYF